jgi:hypothetical protein
VSLQKKSLELEVEEGDPVVTTVRDITITVPIDTIALIDEPNDNEITISNTSDPGAGDITIAVEDDTFSVSPDDEPVTAYIVAPTIDDITGPIGPVNINDQPAIVAVTFIDPGTAETLYVNWDWGDGSSDTQTGVTSPASQAHSYAEPGAYSVTVTVEDDDGGISSDVYNFIVIYDPQGGFVTGGGWIYSEAGADKLNPDAEGKATFGFVSKYKKGDTVPTGNTEFMFKAADLNFHSDEYDWLVVTGSDYAKFKGSGTINGEGNYKFMLWAGDGEPDTFRIKIWEEEENSGDEYDIYDNGFDQEIGGGSIVIHTEKKK